MIEVIEDGMLEAAENPGQPPESEEVLDAILEIMSE